MIVDSASSALPEGSPAAAAGRSDVGGSHSPRERSGLGRATLLMAAAVTVAAMGLGAWFLLDEPRQAPRAAPALDFRTAQGGHLSLSSLRGRVVLVSFWGDACQACERQMAAVDQLMRQWQASGLVTVSVAAPDAPARSVRDFAARHSPVQAAAVDPVGEAARLLGPVQVLPTHVLIDRQGQIVQRFEGDVSTARLEGRIGEVLAGG